MRRLLRDLTRIRLDALSYRFLLEFVDGDGSHRRPSARQSPQSRKKRCVLSTPFARLLERILEGRYPEDELKKKLKKGHEMPTRHKETPAARFYLANAEVTHNLNCAYDTGCVFSTCPPTTCTHCQEA